MRSELRSTLLCASRMLLKNRAQPEGEEFRMCGASDNRAAQMSLTLTLSPRGRGNQTRGETIREINQSPPFTPRFFLSFL